MNTLELIQESIEVLKVNKMRTALSALGIIIGVGSVIALMTLGAATQKSTLDKVTALGSNLLTIRPGANSDGFFDGGRDITSDTLTYEDAIAIATEPRITSIDKVASEYTSNNVKVAYERNSSDVSVSGVTQDYFDIKNITIETGNDISGSDLELLNKVVVLGPTIAKDLFGSNTSPLGKIIKIKGTVFTVIGITEEKGETGRVSVDDSVYIPLTTAQKGLFGVSTVSNIYVSALDENSTDIAESQVGYYLLERHGITDPIDADFSISSSSDLIETVTEITGTFTVLLGGIAAISLIVGGIGIMNIMLVTVTERTREIGIRKALGAKRKVIVSQFLIESIILTITGGIIGVILGVLVSFLITTIMDLPRVISYESIGLAVGVSCVIGLVFGWYPAQKASKLQPIEALRYE